MSSPGPVRRQRQNRLAWQQQMERRRTARRVGGMAIGVSVLLLVVGAALSAGADWLSGGAPAEPTQSARAGWTVVSMTEPVPNAPPAAPAPLRPIAVEDFGDLAFAAEPEPVSTAQAEPKPVLATAPPSPEPVPAPTAKAVASTTTTTGRLPTVPVLDAARAEPAPPPVMTKGAVVAENVPAWRRFAVAAPLVDTAMIAVIIDDVGLNAERTRATIDLPRPLTLSFLPYGVYAEPLAAEARRAGHEVMLHLPMQPEDSAEDPGPKALLVGLTQAELSDRLDWYLDHLSGYVGVNNHMGSRFTQSADGMALVMRELRRRGLLFVDSMTHSRSVALKTARRMGVPSLARDVFLDNTIDARHIARRLAEVEDVARRTGQAIAIGHPHWATVEALKAWLPTLRDKGFTLAPVSAILRRRLTG
ncbi:MAG: divergent polysaccharide deacetylase family protein [Alphaproteobacteria bacterium]